MALQRTLILIKPDAMQRRLAGRLIARLEDKSLKLVGLKLMQVTSELAKQLEQRRHMQSFIDRFRAQANKASQAQSRIKALARLQPIAAIAEERVAPFHFPSPDRLSEVDYQVSSWSETDYPMQDYSKFESIPGVDVTVGAFVQANFGLRHQLSIAGVPVGRFLGNKSIKDERGSIIGIIATDAPLLPHQLKRLARRISLGIGRSGAISGHGSGDIFMAFSTANSASFGKQEKLAKAEFIPDTRLDKIFEAVIQSVDEAIMNSLFANKTMQGFNGNVVEALPHAEVLSILRKHNRI